MPNENSYVERILGLYRAHLVDCAREYPTLTKEFDRDFKRLSSAAKEHGIRFFMDVMPAYRKHFDRCLDARRLTASGLLHFGVDRQQRTIPRLFRGLVLRVFDRNGDMKSNPDVQAVRLIRQLLGVVRKMRMACSTRDTGKTVREFFRVEAEVWSPNLNWNGSGYFYADRARTLTLCDAFWRNSVTEAQFPSMETTLLPTVPTDLLVLVQQVADLITSQLGVFVPTQAVFKHGPGAVSDSRFDETKYSFKTWPDRLNGIFPLEEFAYANYSVAWDVISQHGDRVPSSREHPAKLCAVPKTISRPRLIACEPTSLQWCQQALRSFMYERVAKSWISRFVNFHKQELNGDAALKASIDHSCATIDLSSASDRISCWLVERVFRCSPSLLSAMQASRSVWLTQDICKYSPRHILLRKYSTMGNATTFPVQTLCFLAMALASVLYVRKLRCCLRSIESIPGDQVRVFGDDIVVPLDAAGVLMDVIKALGLRVNTDKTFTGTSFRESCGVDAFMGVNVTTVNVLDPLVEFGPGSVASVVATHHNLCDRGYLAAASYIRKTADSRVPFRIRSVQHGSGLFGWSDLDEGSVRERVTRYNPHLQILEEHCAKLTAKRSVRQPEDESGLLQFFTEAREHVVSSVSNLGTVSQRPRVGLRLGWEPI